MSEPTAKDDVAAQIHQVVPGEPLEVIANTMPYLVNALHDVAKAIREHAEVTAAQCRKTVNGRRKGMEDYEFDMPFACDRGRFHEGECMTDDPAFVPKEP